MKKLLWLLFVPGILSAQNLRSLTRATAVTGVNDSALVLVSDSANRTRAESIGELKRTLSRGSAFDSVRTVRLFTDTIRGGSGVPALTIQSGVGASKFIQLNATNAASASIPTLAVLDSQVRVQIPGRATRPALALNNTATTGLYGTGTDTIHFATGSAEVLRLHGVSGAPVIRGGAGNMTIQAGTGASRTMTLQTTTSGSAVDNTLVLSDNTATFNTADLIADGRFRTNGAGAASQVAIGIGSADEGFYTPDFASVGIATSATQTLVISGGASASLTGGAGNMTVTAGTGNSRTLTLQTTTSAGTAKNTLVLGADSSATFLGKIAGYNGSASNPTFGFSSDGGNGFFRPSGDTIGIAIGGTHVGNFSATSGQFRISGVAEVTPSIAIVARGNDNGIDLYPTDGAGNAVNGVLITDNYVRSGPNGTTSIPTWAWTNSTNTGLYLGSNANTDTIGFVSNGNVFARGFQDTLLVVSKAKALALTAASGTPNTVCIDATTKQLLENAAADCTVSSVRFKKNIQDLSPAQATSLTMMLAPKTFNYINGSPSFGLIAEQADSVSTWLSRKDSQGRINSIDYNQVLTLLLSTVQAQQKKLEKLCQAGITPAC